MDKLYFSAYELQPIAAPNSRSGAGARRGALIRVSAPGKADGFADLHPWPELGELPLEKHLDSFRAGTPTALARRALDLAELDSEAREQGRSLLAGLEIPESHYLVTSLDHFEFEQLERVIRAGFSRIKVKAGREIECEATRLGLLSAAAPAQVKFRVDFNASLDRAGMDQFLSKIGSGLSAIDFVEDPMPWNREQWGQLRREWGVRLASDRECPGPEETNGVDVQVVKPALMSEPGAFATRFVFTSNLDHPVGQVHAAVQAARFSARAQGKLEACGLVSQHAYAPNPYSELLGRVAPRLAVPEGVGVGFDSLLEHENWVPLR